MDALIIGNSPSLINKGLGKKINNFDGTVIRFADTKYREKKDYGNRFDCLICTYSVKETLKADDIVPKYKTWMYDTIDRLNTKEKIRKFENEYSKYKVQIMRDVMNKWKKVFVNMVKDTENPYTRISRGSAAIIFVASHIKRIKQIYIAAMDNLWNGTNKRYRSNPKGHKYYKRSTPHNMKIEHDLIFTVADYYHVNLCLFNNI